MCMCNQCGSSITGCYCYFYCYFYVVMDGWMDGAILNIKDFLCGGKEVVTVNTEVLSQSLVSRETSISLAFFPNISL
jgi:hypothetical protein